MWKLDSDGRRIVEPKAETKKRTGRSPDDTDAFNLWSMGEIGYVCYDTPFTRRERYEW
jgi:hypothetical protein